MITLLANHANGSFPDLRGVVSFVAHGSILSNDGVSGKTGAVHGDWGLGTGDWGLGTGD
jgi:hypothetical protein